MQRSDNSRFTMITMTFVLVCLACAATRHLKAQAAPHTSPQPARPNILWITVEDMSPTLGCWGDEYADTPNIDRLAEQSIRFKQAFATAPVCSPVRSCLITGCYATRLGTQRLRSHFPVPAKMRGFPALLRDQGYYCTNNVKTDYNTSNERQVIRASWDDCSKSAHWRGRRNGQPFFAVFNDMTTHQSRTMVNPYSWFVEQVQSQLPPDRHHDPRSAPVPPYYPDTPEVRKTVARYYDCVSVMDLHVGQILAELEQDGLADDTIVFFYSDHGSGMPRHKRLLLDSGMHVPLLVRFPEKYRHLAGRPTRGVDERLVSFVDFPVTVLSICGVDAPAWMQGVPFLGSRIGLPRRYVYGARDRVDEVFDLARSIRGQRFLYVRNFMPHLSYNQPSFYSDQGTIRQEINRAAHHPDQLTPAQKQYAGPSRPWEELYECRRDPMCLHNLADDPAFARDKQRLRQALEQWILAQPDLGFLPEEEVWPRLGDRSVYELADDRQAYPLEQLFQAANLVGAGADHLLQLTASLQDPEAGVRYWAAVGLAALEGEAESARPQLEAALRDSSAAVRIEAAGALARMGHPRKALTLLTAELASSNRDAALHAARTIELMGEAARAALPAMRAARRQADGPGDQNMFIRFATTAFLQALGESVNK